MSIHEQFIKTESTQSPTSSNKVKTTTTTKPPTTTHPAHSVETAQMAQPVQPTTTSSLPTPEDGQQCSNCGTTKTPLWRRAPDGTLICNACGLYLRSNHTHRPVNLKRPPNTITISKEELGSCKGDGRCNGTGGSAACRGCPAFNNRIVAKKQLLEKSPKNEDVKIKTDISANGEEGGQSGISENNASTNSQTKSDNSNSGQAIERSKTSASAASATGSTDENSLAIACYNCDTTITPLWRRDDAGNTICNACGLFYRLHGSHRPIKMKRSTIKRRKRNVSDHKSKEESKDVKMSVTSPGRMVSLTASPTPTPSHASPSLQQKHQSPAQSHASNTASPPPSSSLHSSFVNRPMSPSYNRLPPFSYSIPFQRASQLGQTSQGSTPPPPLPPQQQQPSISIQQQQQQQAMPMTSTGSHMMPHSLYPRYSGNGRLPNGPGPLPGPPPPMPLPHIQSQAPQQMQHLQPMQMQLSQSVSPLPQPSIYQQHQYQTVAESQQQQQQPPPTLPPINRNTNTTSVVAGAAGCCSSCGSSKRTPTPMAIDFTATYKKETRAPPPSSTTTNNQNDSEGGDTTANTTGDVSGTPSPSGERRTGQQKRALTIGGLLNE
ncbi:Sfu1 transcriptional regulator of iron-responsive genes [Candida orthopsilosis Co 90-125]|uniref:Sfu1 transcriptional regulator of iron-responsive genes n=1 Tax=Candida orthopsilosis (strain 90-125) TaxID=1136231 RepID=H8X9W8_CANO9|nr:Sfu1 transcriptional regulator of iron-responsive genes [Candida orthopsilosis Co 90-125]CCG24785.1 Sfu1 transcriptional regulator of iron-responsive genes [Candida orthopsilosis Co 90-125]